MIYVTPFILLLATLLIQLTSGVNYVTIPVVLSDQGHNNIMIGLAMSCEIIAMRESADHPLLLSTSRHITQGLIDVREETWEEATGTLSGKSAVVGDDPYELRIAVPKTGNWRIGQVKTDGTDCTIRVVTEATGSARVVIDTPISRDIGWSITFDSP